MRWIAVTPIAILLLLIHMIFADTLSAWRGKSFDFYQELYTKQQGGDLPVIVLIDDATLAEKGRWPWPRSTLAEIISKIHAAQPSVLGVDILFPETQSPQEDAALVDALKQGPSVLAMSAGGVASNNHYQSKIGWSEIGSDYRGALDLTSSFLVSISPFAEVSAGMGVVRSTPDTDGVVRSAPMVLASRSGDDVAYWPHFAMELVRVHFKDSGYAVRLAPNGFDAVRLAGATVPVAPDGSIFLLDHKRAATNISALDLDRPDTAGQLKGRVVILAVSAVGLDTFHATPVVSARPGAEVHALLTRQLMEERSLTQPASALTLERVLFVLSCLALLLISYFTRGRFLYLTLSAAVLIATPFALGFAQYYWASKLFDFLQPTIGIGTVSIAQIGLLYSVSEVRRRRLQRQFALFLSPDVVQQLQASGQDPKTQAEKREITVMMIDIRGFTKTSETLPADELVTTINRFMEITSKEIFRTNGTIDKFMGDAVLAFWNAPIDQPDHGALALDAVQGIFKAIESENETRAKVGLMPIHIGAGIETGICSVGNFGSESRLEYTAIGSAVNMSARLESATKKAEQQILLGPGFAEHSQSHVDFLSHVDLAGFAEPVPVYIPKRGNGE